MATATQLVCPSCGRSHGEAARVCGLCGELVGRARARLAVGDVDGDRKATERTPGSSAASPPAAAQRARLEPWAYLGLGLVSAPLFAWAPILATMAWFLGALVHEMGHAALAWLCGMPSVPAISLAGHAAAVHGPPSALLALLCTAVLATLAWTKLAGRARVVAVALVVVLHPALAFSPARELVHLLGGHGAELAFATLCLWKALDGGFTQSRLERALYGTVGWTLLGANASLCLGLVRSAAERAQYRSSGSFGLTNDYLRAAQLLGWTLPSVALGMLLLALLVLPAALGLWRLSSRAHDR